MGKKESFLSKWAKIILATILTRLKNNSSPIIEEVFEPASLSIQTLLLLVSLVSGYYIVCISFFFKVIEYFPNKSPDLSTKNKDEKESSQPELFPPETSRKQRRILPLHLCCPCSRGQYVIFKQKNKDNSSLVNIKRVEVGKIIKKLNEWDYGLVDFSIEVPLYFQKLDTKSIVEKADNEGVVSFEEIQIEK